MTEFDIFTAFNHIDAELLIRSEFPSVQEDPAAFCQHLQTISAYVIERKRHESI